MFRNLSLLALFIFSMTIVVFPQAGRVSGKVTYGDNTPLHSAHVEITQTKQSAETDDGGDYEIAGVAPGTYTVLVHLEGFSDATRSITVPATGNVTANFALQITSLTEQVTVTASGVEQSVFDSFQSVNSVGSTRIAERAATSPGGGFEGETGGGTRRCGPR